jgi:hypothetical protein
MLGAGCAMRTGHTIQPYGRDAKAAHELEDQAIRECRARRGTQPPASFTTDGCSWWPDGNYARCCVDHDRAYWCGGTFKERMNADAALAACVEKEGGDTIACMMRAGVFVGGAQLWPTSFRWGYGWAYPSDGP